MGGHSRHTQVRPNMFEPNRARRSALVLFGREQQFVEDNATGALDHTRIDQECAVGSNRNFGSVRKRDRRADVDYYLARRETHPKKHGLKRKRGNYFTAILKQ